MRLKILYAIAFIICISAIAFAAEDFTKVPAPNNMVSNAVALSSTTIATSSSSAGTIISVGRGSFFGIIVATGAVGYNVKVYDACFDYRSDSARKLLPTIDRASEGMYSFTGFGIDIGSGIIINDIGGAEVTVIYRNK